MMRIATEDYGVPEAFPDQLFGEETGGEGGATGLAVGMLLVGGLLGAGALACKAVEMGVAIVAIGGLLAILVSPFVGACLLAASIPLMGLLQLVPGVFTASKAIAIVVAVSFIPRLLQRDLRQYFRSRSLRLYFIVPLWGLLITPFGDAPLAGMIQMGVHAQLVGLCFLVTAIPSGLREERWLCISASAGGMLLGLYILLFGMGDLLAEEVGRLGAGTNANVLANALATCFLLSLIGWHGASRGMKGFIVVMDLFILVAIIMTGSRGAWLGLAAGIAFAPLITRQLGARQRLGFIAMMLVITLGVVGLIRRYALEETTGMVASRLGQSREQMSGSRIEELWPAYLEMLKGNLIMGAGPGVGATMKASHSDYIQMLGERGLVGFLLFVTMLMVFFREALRNPDPWPRLVCVAIVIFLAVSGLTHNTTASKHYPLAVGVLAYFGRQGSYRGGSWGEEGRAQYETAQGE